MAEFQRVHGYIQDGFPRASSADDVKRYELTPEQVARYHENGFLAGVRILEPAQIAELSRRLELIRRGLHEHMDRLYEVEAAYLERPHDVVFHFLGAWLVDPWFHDIIFSPQVTAPISQLLGVRRVRFWHDQVFYKPPRHRGVVPWHQDYSYWTRAAPPNHITINILLDDASLENGCLHYVPGSHRWGLLPKVPFGGSLDAVMDHLPEHLKPMFKPVPVPGKPGEASFHHSHTVHGSYGNNSDRPRRAVVLNYMGPETRCVDGSRPLLKGVPLIAEGALIEGDYFPIALDLDRLAASPQGISRSPEEPRSS
ncbi:MAG: phytanoyl-CoA dioxygenase family protein [Acidobacteria bacterium]|nr:MAG: phytanoyl-CoA dioxygenase family protein [Acidobacteriota bacterium]